MTTKPDRPHSARSLLTGFAQHPSLTRRLVARLPFALRGFVYGRTWDSVPSARRSPVSATPQRDGATANPLEAYFDELKVGHGIWKWRHYFDIYHRHFAKFVGRNVHVLEVGIYSGGSLKMWREYFGPRCQVYGIDIEEACKVYADDRTTIFIGDQADRSFWHAFKQAVPTVDIVIDDGGHLAEQRVVTLEEMLPHLQPGGVYLCEDVRGDLNLFSSYVYGLATHLNSWTRQPGDREKHIISSTPFQSAVHSIHSYPFVTVIERSDAPVTAFLSEKHGTEWQPFFASQDDVNQA